MSKSAALGIYRHSVIFMVSLRLLKAFGQSRDGCLPPPAAAFALAVCAFR